MNIMTKGDLGRKGLIWLACPDYCLSLREVSAGTQTGAERDSGGELLTDLLDLLSVASQLAFLYTRTTCPGLLPPRASQALLHPTDLSTFFSIESPSSLVTLACVKLTKIAKEHRSPDQT